MKVIHKKINFQDSRGSIRDIFVDDPKSHCTIIFSKKGAVRGNHYHKKSTQYTYVVRGKLLMLSQKVGKSKIYRHTLKDGDLMVHKPREIHAMKALSDTTFLAFADGVRGGKKGYEADTIRVEPLI